MNPPGMFTRLTAALQAPSANLSWLQLGAASIFVLTVALMWRQVTLIIMREI